MPNSDPSRMMGPYGWLRLAYHFPNFCKLFLRLFKDKRTPLWTKAFLLAAVVYLLVPFDLIPLDLSVPVLGTVDDIAILGLALRSFFRNVPREVVLEHVRKVNEEDRRKKS